MRPIDPDESEGLSRGGSEHPATKGVGDSHTDPTLDLTPGGTPTAALTREALPATVGRYSILRELGRGGMGVVYLGQDPILHRAVAIKRLPASVASDPDRLERFRQEARLLASLNHPNIATIYSLEEEGDHCFLTMEAIEGETLAARIARGPLDPPEVIRVGRQIARALEIAHRQGVVHRDLKPGNIMFSAEGDAKVLDFGLAVPASQAQSESIAVDAAADSTPEISGTPGYMSPEQIAGGTSDPRMDVWSFGCVLHECLTGSRVVSGDTPAERLRTTSSGPIELETLPDTTPPRLGAMLRKCLEVEPAARHASMTEPRQLLDQMLAEISFQSVQAQAEEARGQTVHNLPRQISSFIGRAREVDEVLRRLEEHRLVTLTGIGGVGKTRLALRAAELLLAGRYDGIWFVPLAPVADPDEIAHAVQEAIGIPESLDRTAFESITAYLGPRRALVVLDNCEHVIEGAARLVNDLLRELPGVRLLVTSRERLAVDGEVSYPVPLLDLPEVATAEAVHGAHLQRIADSTAVQLLLQRAQQVGATIELDVENARALAQICQRLDGIPLAIELAASRLKTLGIDETLRRMDDRFRLLTGGSRGDMPHHRTLRALIDWSHEQLAPEEQALLRRLSIFAGHWTLEAAEAVASGGLVNDWEVLDLCARLTEKSLIEADTGSGAGTARFRMLETVKAYAAERLEEAGEAADTRLQHRDYFVALARRAEPELMGPNQMEWYGRIGVAHDDIRRAFEACRDVDADPTVGLRLAASLFRYWYTRGHWTEADNYCREFLQRTEHLAPTADTAKVMNCIAAVALHHGRLAEAKNQWEKTLEVWLALDMPAGIGAIQLNLGNVAYTAGDYVTAEAGYRACLESYRRIDNPDGVCRALVSLCNISFCLENNEAARNYGREAVERLSKMGHAELLAHALTSLGTAELRLGNLESARSHYEESLAMQKDLGDMRNTAIATINLAVVFHKQKKIPEAYHHFQESMHRFHALGDVSSVASALEGLAGVEIETGNIEHAMVAYGAACEIREAHGMPGMPEEGRLTLEGIERCRNHLGETRADTLFMEGKAMGVDEAYAWAARTMTGQARDDGSGSGTDRRGP